MIWHETRERMSNIEEIKVGGSCGSPRKGWSDGEIVNFTQSYREGTLVGLLGIDVVVISCWLSGEIRVAGA